MAPSLLAEITGLTRGAVSKLADRLVAKKMIIRSAGGSDRRFQSIELSAAGRRLVPKLAAIADTNDKEFFAPLSVQERKTLMATLQKLVRAHELSKIPIE
jgi:DNA-binding MarR family transcriptional regulator